MNSTVVQNVVTYDTVINFNNPDRKLFPGMTAYVTIPVATTNSDSIKIPNAALRYKPDLTPAEIRALYQQYGIADGEPAASSANSHAVPRASSRSNTIPIPEKPAAANDTQVVWKLLPDKTLQPVRIKTGITDHTFTELIQEINGSLKVGDELVTGIAQGRASTARIGGPGAPRAR
jgi:HlyD family secretion protein